MPSTNSTPERARRLVADGVRVDVEEWLLQAADDAGRARHDWDSEGVALLRCGGRFGVIRISAALVHAAAGTDDLSKVDQYLARVLLGGPVFMERDSRRYFALVRADTGRRSEWKLPRDDAEALPNGAFIGVPAPSATVPHSRLHWCVPVSRPGVLVAADAVRELVRTGRDRLASERSGG